MQIIFYTYVYEDKIPAKMEGNPMHAHSIPPQAILVAIFSSFRHWVRSFCLEVQCIQFASPSIVEMTRCTRGRTPHICMQLHHPIRHQFPLLSKQVLKSHSNISLCIAYSYRQQSGSQTATVVVVTAADPFKTITKTRHSNYLHTSNLIFKDCVILFLFYTFV